MAIKTNKVNKFLDSLIGIVAFLCFFVLFLEWGLKIGNAYRSIFNTFDAVILFIFLLEIIMRFLFYPSKKEYFKKYWIDILILIPFIQFIHGLNTARIFIVLKQIVIIFRILVHTKIIQKLISLLGLKPAQLLVVSFITTILIGAFLLTLPIAAKNGQSLNFIDALFTATSATCVTGLIVKDTGTFFAPFGQLVILSLIQAGALGIMTFSITLFLAVGQKMSYKEAITMQEVLDQESIMDILGLIKFIAKMTILIEFIGALFLYAGFMNYLPNPGFRLYAALFHSISAFCNAGFSIFPDSLTAFARDVPLNLCFSFLIIIGGLGFIVVKDIYDKYITKKTPKTIGLKLHSKIVLTMTTALLIIGTVCIFCAENNSAFKDMILQDKLLISFFQSVTARTAGFNTLNINLLSNASIFSLIVLMFIGASSGSTGGGIKTTTFSMILMSVTSRLKNKDHVSIFKRKIPDLITSRALIIFISSIAMIILFAYLTAIFENLAFRDIIFEVVSAFGTVGLSCGITAKLHPAGKILITLLMFLGRLGPLTILLAFSRYKRKIYYKYAEEKIMVG
ncbi:MAG: potassium transporter Trk [Candidatus Omnitrophota bacterium]|nr:MAG: potassium transporter Trk [Candidatus Omnitrophota bacterium]